MSMISSKNLRALTVGSIFFICLWGIVLRFLNITQNEFFFYDEGYYLNLHRQYLELIAAVHLKDVHDFFGALYLCLRLSLGEGKALWFMISHLRVFWGGLEQWFFPRLVASLAGVLTLPFIFLFAKRFFNSRRIGWLSVILLAVLPSHVFYSRLALQETLCTLFFLAGIYFYLFPLRFGPKTFLSVFLLVLAYFLNYRLIILPVLVLFCEVWLNVSERRKPDFRKYLWHTVAFLFLVFFIGNIDRAQNTIVTFAWMFYQARLAKQQFELFNFLSYPYYIFRLEGILFGILFFGSIYLLFKKQWRRAFPFLFACFYMAIYSLTADKGARYLCVMLPFIVMAAASLIEYLLREQRSANFKALLAAYLFLMVAALTIQSTGIARLKSDYRISVQYLTRIDPQPKIVSTQSWVQNLYTKKENVFMCPKDFPSFLRLHAMGFRYLVIDPQAYVSWTADSNKFTLELKDYLNFIVTQIQPLKVFAHFNDKALERFVFEHNDNLGRSLAFLKRSGDEHFGVLRIYDMNVCIDTIEERIAQKNHRKKE